jgi:hypothetical protein
MKDGPAAPIVDLTFPHNWQAEILVARPLIPPQRHFVYPLDAEEVERGALEVLIRANLTLANLTWAGPTRTVGRDFSPDISPEKKDGALAPEAPPQPFLATCALGFRDAIVPTGLWSCPNPNEICAVSGGYAYMIDTTAPERFTMIAYRPVLEVRALAAQGLLLFVSHHYLLAWGEAGQAWQSEKLSDEGVTITAIEGAQLHGLGWNMIADKETPFTLDLRTGLRT